MYLESVPCGIDNEEILYRVGSGCDQSLEFPNDEARTACCDLDDVLKEWNRFAKSNEFPRLESKDN